MGAQLVEIYTEAEKVGGLKAKLKMAMLTRLSLNAAKDAPDSPESIKLFKDSLETIKKQGA